MNNKLFSFAIITYRNFEGIEDTLHSLFEQDYPSIELIIADDGSDNYNDEIESIEKYIEQNKKENIVNVIYSHADVNQGTVKNINNAIKESNGIYFKALGCGDILADSNAISIYCDALDKNDYDIVFSKLVGVTPLGEKVYYLASCENDYDKLRSMTPSELCNRLYVRNCLPAPAWVAKKSLFERNGLFPETARLIEDYPYWLTLCQNGEKIGFIDDILIEYSLNGVSSTGNYGISFMEDMFKIYNKHIFPYDKRYGVVQPIYNGLKRLGLEAYMARAKWNSYTFKDKLAAYFKYGLFFMYIDFGNWKTNRKNK